MQIMSIYTKLAWEPSAAQVSHSYSHCLPALERFYREIECLLLKSTGPLNLESSNQAKIILMGLPSSPIQILMQISPGVPEL